MKRKFEIENGRRVSKCGAKHMKQFPEVVMQEREPVSETIKKKELRKPEPVKEQMVEHKEPESLFDFRKGRRENATTEDEQ